MPQLRVLGEFNTFGPTKMKPALKYMSNYCRKSRDE